MGPNGSSLQMPMKDLFFGGFRVGPSLLYGFGEAQFSPGLGGSVGPFSLSLWSIHYLGLFLAFPV